MANYFFKLTVAAGLILLGLGGCLLYDYTSSGGPTQLPELLIGAVVVTLGIFLLCSQTRLLLRQSALDEQHRNS